MQVPTTTVSLRRLQRALILGLVVLVACCVGASLLVYYTNQRQLDRAAWTRHSYEVIGLADNAQYFTARSSVEHRTYLLTGNTAQQQLAVSLLDSSAQLLSKLVNLTADNPPQQQIALQFLQHSRLLAHQQAKLTAQQPGLVTALATLDSMRNKFRNERARFVAEEQHLLGQRSAATESAEKDTQAALWLLLGLMAAVAGVGTAFVRRRITAERHYVNLLEEQSRELSAANEEFESFNEELARTNEELSASNEETEAINEELRATLSALETAEARVELLAKQQRLEVEVAQAERDLQDVLESTTDAFFEYSPEWTLKRMNKAAEDQSRTLRADVIGKNVWDVYWPDTAYREASTFYRHNQAVMKDRKVRRFTQYYPPVEGWFEVLAVPLTNGGVANFIHDITERRKLQALLDKERQETANILESTPDGFVQIAADWTVLRLNSAGERIGGVTLADAKGKNHWDVWPTSVGTQFWIGYHRVMETRKPELFTEYYPANNNWLEVSTFPVLDGGIGVFFRDVSVQKKLELQLETQRQELADVLENMGDGFVTLAADWTILQVNSRYEQMAQKSKQELIGSNLWELFPGAQPGGLYWDEFHRVRDERVHRRFVDYYPQPLDVWTEINAFPLANGTIAIFTRDVTQQHRAQLALVKAGQDLSDVLENVNDGFFQVAPDWTLLQVNRRMAQLTQLTRQELIGQNFWEVFAPAATPATTYWQEYHTAMNGREYRHFIDNYAPLDLWTEVDAYPTPDGGLAVFFRDISSQEKSRRSLEESLKEKETLLAEIHHRVKNNLAIVASLLDLQGMRTANQDAAAALKESRSRVRAMALIHEKLYQSENLSRVNFGLYLAELLAQVQTLYADDKVKITVEIKVNGIYLDIVNAVPAALLLNELLTNSFKHAFNGKPQGHVLIEMRAVDILELGDEAKLELIFTDDGVGMEVNKRREGSLGLTLIQGLVSQLNGTLAVQSTPQQGTSYTITIVPNRVAIALVNSKP